ncbi:glycosyltransferase family 2 protein [Providencia sp. PAZ2]|uniref:glycosyltransferase family 2 protein n=1 Tax=Providencia lanzhouensis TaxID=3378099 RepID=UPI003D26B978
MGNDLVSIIMPAYNAEDTITESIESIIDQSYPNWELIIIDDCSTDNTLQIIQYYESIEKRIKVIKNRINLGVAESRNLSISISEGKFICFLDSDDIWFPNKIEKQISILNSGWNVVCSNYETFNTKGTINIRFSPEIITYDDMLRSCFIGNLTGMYNAYNVGKIYQKKVGAEDYLMWLSILEKTKNAYCVQEPLAKYRIHDSSLSSNKIRSIKWQWNIYRKELNLNFIRSSYYLCCYIFHAFKKRI